MRSDLRIYYWTKYWDVQRPSVQQSSLCKLHPIFCVFLLFPKLILKHRWHFSQVPGLLQQLSWNQGRDQGCPGSVGEPLKDTKTMDLREDTETSLHFSLITIFTLCGWLTTCDTPPHKSGWHRYPIYLRGSTDCEKSSLSSEAGHRFSWTGR